MVALSASRLVWPAMVEIIETTSVMLSATSVSRFTVVSVRRVSSTAWVALVEDWLTWVTISWIDADISSLAAATVWTLAEVSSAAVATVVA